VIETRSAFALRAMALFVAFVRIAAQSHRWWRSSEVVSGCHSRIGELRMTARSLVAVLLLPFGSAPAPKAGAADPPAVPILKFRTELGGGDVSWAQIGIYAPDGKTLYTVAGGGNPGLVYVIDPVAGQKLATGVPPE